MRIIFYTPNYCRIIALHNKFRKSFLDYLNTQSTRINTYINTYLPSDTSACTNCHNLPRKKIQCRVINHFQTLEMREERGGKVRLEDGDKRWVSRSGENEIQVVLVIKRSAKMKCSKGKGNRERRGEGCGFSFLGNWNVDLKGREGREKRSRIRSTWILREVFFFFRRSAGCVGSFWKSVFLPKQHSPQTRRETTSRRQEVSNLKCKLRRIFGISRRRNGREIKM